MKVTAIQSAIIPTITSKIATKTDNKGIAQVANKKTLAKQTTQTLDF